MKAVCSPLSPVDAIVTASIQSPACLDDLLARVVDIVACDRPFGVVLVVHGVVLERSSFAAIRRLPGGRARFGTWCRGVGYVFETSAAQAAARRHLFEARYLWGSRIFVTRATDDATVWLLGEFHRYAAGRS
jgi:hypothetical protein